MRLSAPSVIAASLAAATACTSSDPAPTRDAESNTAARACVLANGTCSATNGICCAQSGILFDETRQCVTSEKERAIGCAPVPLSTGGACVQLGVIGCTITKEGGVRRVWFMPSLTPGWEAEENCSDALRTSVTAFKKCE